MTLRKKILILGATQAQIPLINEAIGMGYYVVVCSYNPEEPGIEIADEYYNVSTADKDSVLKLARELNASVVTSWASDIAVATAAYVSESLGQPTNPYHSVMMLAEKDTFRNFLKKNGFSVPGYQHFSEKETQTELNHSLSYPVIVKPVDSSGGRGVTKVLNADSLLTAAKHALSFSKNRKIIVEEFIESPVAQLHGDGFVLNGELIFTSIGDHYYSTASDVIPVGTYWPSSIPDTLLKKVIIEVNRCVELSGISFGPVNIEVRVDKNHKIYIIELAPRGGVHSGSDLTKMGTGADLPYELMKYLNGQEVKITKTKTEYVAYYLLHSESNGTFSGLKIDSKMEEFISEVKLKVKYGETVQKYKSMNDAIGILKFKFDQKATMQNSIQKIQDYVSVIVKKDSKTE